MECIHCVGSGHQPAAWISEFPNNIHDPHPMELASVLICRLTGLQCNGAPFHDLSALIHWWRSFMAGWSRVINDSQEVLLAISLYTFRKRSFPETIALDIMTHWPATHAKHLAVMLTWLHNIHTLIHGPLEPSVETLKPTNTVSQVCVKSHFSKFGVHPVFFKTCNTNCECSYAIIFLIIRHRSSTNRTNLIPLLLKETMTVCKILLKKKGATGTTHIDNTQWGFCRTCSIAPIVRRRFISLSINAAWLSEKTLLWWKHSVGWSRNGNSTPFLTQSITCGDVPICSYCSAFNLYMIELCYIPY